MPLIGTTMHRLLAASSEAAEFALTGPGRIMLEDLEGLGRIGLGGVTGRLRSVEIRPIGSGAEDATFSARVYRLKHSSGSSRPTSGQLDYLGLMETTLGTGTAPAADEAGNTDTLVAAGELLGDTIVWTPATDATTPKGLGAVLASAHGAEPEAFSPADNTHAALVIPDVFDGDELVIDFELGTATKANMLWTGYA